MSRMSRLRHRLSLPAEDLAWLAAMAAAPVLAATFAWVTPQLAKLYPSADVELFSTWRGLVDPEPIEDVRGIVTLAAPFAVAALVVLLGTRRPARPSLDRLIFAAQVIGALVLIFAVADQSRRVPLLPLDYLDPLLLSVPNVIAGVVIGVMLTGLVLTWGGRVPRWLDSLRRPGNGRWLAPAIATLVTAVFLLPAVVTDATVAHSGRFATPQIFIHADDYFAVVNGRTPLVDYFAQYTDLLPLAMAPVLAAFHSSLASFSIAMCVLSSVALLAIFGVFVAVTGRPWVALGLFVPFLALSLFPWHDQGAAREFNGNYFALLPDRLLGPFVLAWLIALSTRRPVPPWVLFAVAGLTVLNNPEFGVAALIALIVASAATHDGSTLLGRSAPDTLIQAGIGVGGAVLLVCTVILIRTGGLPDPSQLTYFNRLFLRGSYGLSPMKPLGLHWAVYASYAAALLIAAVRYVQRDPDRTLTAMLAYSGGLGLATGMYFVGRSLPVQLMILFPIWGLCLALLGWTAAKALRSARGDSARLRRLLLPATAALIGFGVMIAAIDRVPPPWRQVQRLSDGGVAISDSPNAQRFVDAQTESGESIFLIGTPLDHRVAERAGVTNTSPVSGYVSLITADVADRGLDQLEDDGGDEVFEAVTGPSAVNPSLYRITPFAAILRQRGYRLITQDPSSGLRLWRRAAT
jgi:hypothetical protein